MAGMVLRSISAVGVAAIGVMSLVLLAILGLTMQETPHPKARARVQPGPTHDRELQSSMLGNIFSSGFQGSLPSVYLNYQFPTPLDKKSWFTSMQVKESASSTYFSVQKTQFGYFGLQQTVTLAGGIAHIFGLGLNSYIAKEWYGIAIFSIWDTPGNPCEIVKVGEGAKGGAFGNEGTGCQIKMDTEWGSDTYGFLTTLDELDGDRIQLSAWWHDANGGGWKLVGTIATLKQGRRFGEGGVGSFIEQFWSVETSELRAAEFFDGFFETSSGTWVPVTQAFFSSTPTELSNINRVGAVVQDGSSFLLGVSGPGVLAGSTPDGTFLSLRAEPQPSQVPMLQEFIGLRATGTLQQGCEGSSCPIFTRVKASLSQVVDLLTPGSALEFFFEIVLLIFWILVAWTIYHFCFASGVTPTNQFSSGDSFRSLVRNTGFA
mmetsp:Transcript_143377/g.458296  ORF Transcript_143377/g.458296 Transcript_143377/m.458296 type:complete len:432 (-) Transcript_143377:246-1541(-)